MAAVDDLKKLLALIPGGASVNQKLADFEAYIRNAAREGALEAVPQIQIEVRKTVEPYVIAAIAIGALGFLMGFKALRASNAKSLAGLRGGKRSKRPSYDTSSGEGQKRLMKESVGHEYVPPRRIASTSGDYGADPIGQDADGVFRWRMVPSGDIVDKAEHDRRLRRTR